MEHAIRTPTWVARHPVASYFVCAYAVSWAFWIPMALAHQTVAIGSPGTHFPGLFGPMIAALVVTRLADGTLGDLPARMMRWRVGVGWALVAIASPLVALALVAAVLRLAGASAPRWDQLGLFNGVPSVGVLGVWLLLVIGGFGEETGWRGFALPRLERTHSPLGATLILALLWAGWHVPTFFVIETYRGFEPPAFIGFLIGLACGAIVLTWLYHRTRESILMVSLWHGSFNLASGTLAARGTIAAVVSTLVMVGAVVLVVLELHARRRGRTVLGG